MISNNSIFLLTCALQTLFMSSFRLSPVTSYGEEASPSGVMAEVDGIQLTRAQSKLEAEIMTSLYCPNLDKNQREARKSGMVNIVIENFVNRSLVLNELKRKNISVSPDDENLAFAQLQQESPSNTKIEGMENVLYLLAKYRAGLELLLQNEGLISEVSEDHIKRFCETNLIPENIRARHILIKVNPNDTVQVKADKRDEIEKIRKDIMEGADFAKVAYEHSDCPSRDMGGDLGIFKRGQMAKPFEEAAFSQKIREIGPIIETEIGYHVIQVLEHNNPKPLPREAIIREIKRRNREIAISKLLSNLREKAVINVFQVQPLESE